MMQGVDLFSGAGGMSTGALLLGIDIRYAVEFSPHAAATFALNHRDTELLARDIRTVRTVEFRELDRRKQLVFFGGPPCQGFSTSNQKNRGFDNEKN